MPTCSNEQVGIELWPYGRSTVPGRMLRVVVISAGQVPDTFCTEAPVTPGRSWVGFM